MSAKSSRGALPPGRSDILDEVGGRDGLVIARMGGDESGQSGGNRSLLRPWPWWRTWLFLAPTLAAVAAACAFWEYLGTGRWFDFSLAAYARDLATPPEETFLAPLNVLRCPWMILVYGLLLGAMFCVPVLAAVLHRMPLGLAFAVLVGLFGHCPMLAVALGIGCTLAGRTSLRRDIPFLAVLLGLVPVGVYLYLSVMAGSGGGTVLPIQRWALRAPLVIGMVTAVVSAAVILTLGRWTGFRPAAVWCVLAVLPGPSVAIFYAKVGPKELDYQLIAQGLGLDDEVFPTVSLEFWKARVGAEGLVEPALRNRVQGDLDTRRGQLLARCERYLRRYPRNERAAEVAWIGAQAASLQLNERAYAAGLIQYTASHPPMDSRTRWQELLRSYPGTPQGVLAAWREGEFALRAREISRAEELLHTAVEQLRASAGDPNAVAPSADVFPGVRSIPSPDYRAQALFTAQRLIWLMEQNHVLKDPHSAEALAGYLDLDPVALRAEPYFRRLGTLVAKYENTPMGENLKLAAAMAMADPGPRVEQLLLLSKQRSDLDAAVEASYELGELTLQKPELAQREDLMSPAAYFELVKAAPPNPWTDLATRRLCLLKATTKPKEPSE